MEPERLDLLFKGERQYIQGPDMFNQMLSRLEVKYDSKPKDIEFIIHQMTDHDLAMVVELIEEPHLENKNTSRSTDACVANLSFTCNEKKYCATVHPLSSVPVQRVPYTETLVTSNCEIFAENKKIRLNDDKSSFSPVEIVVSMNKALHLSCQSKPEHTSWVFCRLDCPSWSLPKNLTGIELTIVQALGSRLTKSQIDFNGETLGTLYFSAKSSKVHS